MLYRKLITGAALLLLSLSTVALDNTEAAIRDTVMRNNPAALELLQQSVDINSGTMNVMGVREVGSLFLERFEALGFRSEWVDGEPFARGGHLSARYGTQGPRVLLIGHLDTVFASDSEFQRFHRIDENSAAGPGATDMKGGDVIILYALEALKSAGVLEQLQVHVVMTGDEESRGQPLELSNKVLIEAGDWADIALGFEDGDSNPKTAVTARRSSSVWELSVTGKPAHSSQIFRPDVGFGAALELSRILNEWRIELSAIPNLTFNPGLLMAGTDMKYDPENTRGTVFGKGNVIAQTAVARGGMRAISQDQIAQAEKIMRRIVDDNLAQTFASLSFRHGYPPMAPVAGNARLLAAYSAISEELGFGPVVAVDPRKAGAADISFVADRVAAAMDGLGLMGSGGHTIDEVADLRTLPQQTLRAALLLYRIASGVVAVD